MDATTRTCTFSTYEGETLGTREWALGPTIAVPGGAEIVRHSTTHVPSMQARALDLIL